MEFLAGVLKKNYGISRKDSLVAMQTFCHHLGNELRFGDMETVKKIIHYYDTGNEAPAVAEQEHRVFLEYYEDKIKGDEPC